MHNDRICSAESCEVDSILKSDGKKNGQPFA